MMEEKTQQCLAVLPGKSWPPPCSSPVCLKRACAAQESPQSGLLWQRSIGASWVAWAGPQVRRGPSRGLIPGRWSARVAHHSPPCIFAPSHSHPGHSLLLRSQMLFHILSLSGCPRLCASAGLRGQGEGSTSNCGSSGGQHVTLLMGNNGTFLEGSQWMK